MKSLKQIADELGVSKQQVYRYVKAECINEVHHDADEAPHEVHQSKSVKYYDEAAESAIKAYFEGKAKPVEVHHEAHQNPDEVHHDAVRIDSLKRENERLTVLLDQLRADHKEEVQRMQSYIDRLTADVEQLRRDLTEERQHSREQAEKLAQLADQAQRLQLMQMQPPAQIEQKPPNFWQRIFGKKAQKHDFDIDNQPPDSSG